MNALPLAVPCAESGALPVLRARRIFLGLAALLVTYLFLAGPLTLRAQSGESATSEAIADEPSPTDIEAKTTPSFAIAGLSFSLAGEHTTGDGPVPITSKAGYAGTVELTCTLVTKTTTPTPPQCLMYPDSVTLKANGSTVSQILIFGKGTTVPPGVTKSGPAPWLAFGGAGTVLACTFFLGIPARRRGWRAVLPVILLSVAIASMTACAENAKMITAGQYTFTVTGVDSKTPTLQTVATVKVHVL
jgi:hypothetical protein